MPRSPAWSGAEAAAFCPGWPPRTRTRPPTASRCSIAANADGVFARLCLAMDQPQLADDPRFATHQARGDNTAELDRLISAWTSRCSSGDVLAVMATHRVPSGRVYTATDALADEHYKARQMVVRMLSGRGQLVPMPGVVPRFSRTPGSIRTPGPALGADTDAVLGSMAGLGGAQIDELRADQVIR